MLQWYSDAVSAIDNAIEELRLCGGSPRHGWDGKRARKILQGLGWHPASEPPEPEDFEPYGIVDTWAGDNEAPYHVTSDQRWDDIVASGVTHWRAVTPPE